MNINVRDRNSGTQLEEKVYGGSWIQFGYGWAPARAFIGSSLIQKLISKLIGWSKKRKASASSIAPFIEEYEIAQERFVVPEGGYKCFNDFFIRKIKPNYAQFPEEANFFGSPCQARLAVFPLTASRAKVFCKGQLVDISEMFAPLKIPERGWLWVFRLAPVDYHRFHFPDQGQAKQVRISNGKLHSVNPVSLAAIPRVFFENYRQLVEFHSENFGRLLFCDVGAMGVGSIVQTYDPEDRQERGAERGYFEFGGSTVVMISSDESRLGPDPDILQSSNFGVESLVEVGQKIGQKGS